MKVTIENLKQELAKSFNGDLDNIGPDTLLKDEVDSLDMMDFYMNIEEEFKVSIPDEDIEKLKDLNDFVKYLESKI